MGRLGYVVVFHEHEQGSAGTVVMMVSANLNLAISTVESLSGYKQPHDRYPLKIVDLERVYHNKAIGNDVGEEISILRDYCPEALPTLDNGTLNWDLMGTIRKHRPLDTQVWINRNYFEVEKFLLDKLTQKRAAGKIR